MNRLLTVTALVLFAGVLLVSRASAVVYHNMISVTHCHPALHEMTSYAGPGWYPGYYPAYGPYRWGSVYGPAVYQPPVTTTSPQLAIDYTNVTNRVMKQIEFGLVTNNGLVAEVKDVGTFSPQVEIKHKFGLSENVFPIQTGLPQCVPLKITFEDGEVWKNPHLPRLKHHLPS